jgi:putative ABC transport system permease protein
VLGSVDVRPFVGGSLQPSVAIDPVLLAIVVAGFSLVVLAAVVVAVLVARRVNPAAALRMGEGG